MNIRCCAVALLLTVSGSVFAADSAVLFIADPLGLWLIAFGIAFLVAEVTVPNYGVIGLGGLLMFVAGALILTNTRMPVPMIIGLGLISVLLLVFLVFHALKTRPRRVVSGDAGLVGSVTPVMALQADSAYNGWVHLQGEQWQVRSATPLQPGQNVRVVGRKGLLLQVAAADAAPAGE
ncbi:MAG: NfeD family protein [Pseudomonas sp.]